MQTEKYDVVFPSRNPRRSIRARAASLVLACGLIATATTGCSSLAASGGGKLQQSTASAAALYTGGSCFYSDRNVAYRGLYWCGPEPRALN